MVLCFFVVCSRPDLSLIMYISDQHFFQSSKYSICIRVSTFFVLFCFFNDFKHFQCLWTFRDNLNFNVSSSINGGFIFQELDRLVATPRSSPGCSICLQILHVPSQLKILCYSKPIDGSTFAEYGDTLEIHCGFILFHTIMLWHKVYVPATYDIIVQTETHVNYYWLRLLLC